MKITPDQVKAARALVGWSQARLAAESGLTKATIVKFEEGKQPPSTLDLSVVRRMLMDAGVEFIAGTEGEPEIRPRTSSAEAAIPPLPSKEP